MSALMPAEPLSTRESATRVTPSGVSDADIGEPLAHYFTRTRRVMHIANLQLLQW
jgi:hypothetical protein